MHLRYDPHCWVLNEPGDWNLWRRIAATGARTAYVPSVVVEHNRERTSIEANPGLVLPTRPTAAELLADVRATDARWLLDVAPLLSCLPTC
jgi:hypothetical protein